MAAVKVGLGVVGFQLEGLVGIGGGISVFLQLELGGGAVVPGVGILGVELQGLAKIGDGPGVVLVLEVGAAPVIKRQRIVCFSGEIGVVVFQCLGQLAGAALGGGAVQQGREQLGLQRKSLGVILRGGGVVVELLVGAGAVVVGIGQLGVGFDGPIKIIAGGLVIAFFKA